MYAAASVCVQSCWKVGDAFIKKKKEKKKSGYNDDCSTVLSSVCLFSISAGLANWFYVTLAALLMYIQYNNSAKTLQEAADLKGRYLFLFAFKE